MKRISMLFLAMLLAAGYAYADSPRMILMEEFTNASCGPCASQNPTYQAFIENNADIVIPIAFHPNFPGSDIMYDHNPTMSDTRINYYSVDGVPVVRVNGVQPTDTDGNAYDGAPADTSDIKLVMNNYTAMSPVDMSIAEVRNGNSSELTITVASSQSLVGKKLRIAAAEFVCTYPEGETAPNGEEHFFWVARKMFDNANGTTIVDDNFEKQVTVTMDSEWNPDNIYFVAWIQDDASKEVLQATTTMHPTATLDVMPNISTVDEFFTKVKRGESVSMDFTVTNNNSSAMDYTFSDASNIPADWSVAISPLTANIAAGGTQIVNVTITAGQQAAYTFGGFTLGINSNEYFAYPSSIGFYSLLAETKYIYYQSHSNDFVYTMPMQNTKFGKDFAVLPLIQYTYDNYPPTDYDCVIFSKYAVATDIADTRPLTDTEISIAEDMMALGKGVLLFSDISGVYADQLASQLPKLNNFLFNKMGLELLSTQQLFNDQGQLYNLDIKGISGDPVSDGIAFTLNSGAANQLYNLWIEFFSVKDGSSTTPILKAELQDGDAYTGFKMEDENQGRVIYVSSGFEGNSEFSTNATFLEKAITWLTANTGSTGPKLAVAGTTNDAIAYGEVTMNTTSSKTITITNSGSENLTYTLSKKGLTPSAFALESKSENTQYTVTPGETQDVTLVFSPIAAKAYTAELVIATNDVNNAELKIALSGTGLSDAVPEISLNSNELTFAETSEAVEKSLTLTNSGTGDLSISSIVMSGTDAAAFEIVSDKSATVAAGATFEINVRFTPTETKDYAATMTIKSNIDDVTVAIAGKGVSSVIDGWAGSVEFVSVNVGPNPVTETATVKYTVGTKAQMIDMYIIDANGNFVAQLVKENNSVAGDATTTFNVANMASGKYFVVANTGNYTTQLPFVIAK